MKSVKLKIFSILLACVILLIIALFCINPRAETRDFNAEVNADLVGQDSERYYNLNIGLKVYYDADKDEYIVSATAEWKKAGIFTKSKKRAEDLCLDLIVLTWGGELRAESENVYGEYTDGSEIAFSRNTHDSYGQFIWQFKEKSNRRQMSFATATFNLKKIGAALDKVTGVRMAYVHTYMATKAAVPIIFGRGLAADKISFSKSEERWRIEINVAGINY